jgi:cold shock CspA family protein
VRGIVVAFDDPRGIGEIEGSEGRRYPFHCTAILDGTRSIEVGAAVSFEVRAATMGRWEAARIEATTA